MTDEPSVAAPSVHVTPGPRGTVVVALRWAGPAGDAPFVVAHAFDGRRLRHGNTATDTDLAFTFAEQLQRAADAPDGARVRVTSVDWDEVARRLCQLVG